MKKRQIIIITLLIISLLVVSLYQTLATDILMNKEESQTADLSYTFDITDTMGRIVNIKAGATKILDIFITNNNNGTINYGVSYTPSTVKTDDITIAQLSISKDKVSGLINKDGLKQISLIIINDSSNNIELTLVPITGYEYGGDLIVPSNHTLITEEYEIVEPLPSLPYNAAQYIESLLSNNKDTMNNDDPDHNVRYMGKDPNNYVEFNNELWRIIGVFNVKASASGQEEKRLKIIRNEPIGKKAWDSSNKNDWTKASLNTYLNGEYYNSLREEAQGQVGDTYWNIGGTANYQNASNGLASHFYRYERGTTTYNNQSSAWPYKIGLMYPSDYGYATSGGTTTNRASCLAKELYNWDSSSHSDCKNNDYLYNSSSHQWTITPYSGDANSVFYVSTSGSVYRYDANDTGNSVSPVLYLKSDVIITGGTGTSTDPYILG